MTNCCAFVKSATVVITSYNYAEFVGDAITSALSQTFPNVQVIVVDDGSTDNSLGVIKSFADRIVLIAQENKGIVAAEYAGFVRATGDLIIFLDSDDLLYPAAVEESAALFSVDTAKVQFYLECVDVNGSPLGFTHPKKMPREEDVERLLFRFGIYPFPPTSGNAYSRRFLQQILPCTEIGIGAHTDLYMTALAPIYGKVRVSEKVLGGYRIHGQNLFGRNPGVLMRPSLQRMRSEAVARVATQRALEAHCARFNRSIEPGLYWRLPHICKGRLMSLKADPVRHPFPGDRAVKLAWYGLLSAVLWPDATLIHRVSLIGSFLLLLLLPQRLVYEWMFILDGGRTRLISFLRRLFYSVLGRERSSGKAPRA